MTELRIIDFTLCGDTHDVHFSNGSAYCISQGSIFDDRGAGDERPATEAEERLIDVINAAYALGGMDAVRALAGNEG